MIFREGRKLPVGVVGLGARGMGQLRVLLEMGDMDVRAVCDRYDDRTQAGAELVFKTRGTHPAATRDYRELVNREDLEVVFVFTSWTTHAMIAVAAMKAGKEVAMEVGGAASLDECWSLVRTSRQTGKNCMMLENCCYGKVEMQVLNMVKKGLFGELVHCQGGYEHDLRDEVGMGDVNRHYRMENFSHRNGELYPTHELGPIAKYLNLNRGNRMTHLTSMASKARGMKDWMARHRAHEPAGAMEFNEGDIVTTMIGCANGETILLTHDCTLPRPYSRGGRVQGTRGIWMEDKDAVFLEGISPENKDNWDHGVWEPLQKYEEAYGHPLWKAYEEFGPRGGHDGMDYLALRAFIESVQNSRETPIDVYDTAAWMAITCLSEQSIAMGSQPVPVPDFTDGAWICREASPKTVYSLDAVHEDLF